MKDSLHGSLSRVSIPLVGHPTAYRKFIMGKNIKVENTQKGYLSAYFLVFIPYFPKRLILDNEELILDKEGGILSLRLRDYLS